MKGKLLLGLGALALVAVAWIIADRSIDTLRSEPERPDAAASPSSVSPRGAVQATEEDRRIFRATMDRVRAERLDTLPIGALVAALGRGFVGAPYTPHTLELAGPERLVVNLREFDCVTFVENMLALARTVRSGGDFGAYTEELRRIRYRDGRLTGYPDRLHYFSDWIANNAEKGVVEPMTAALGGEARDEPVSFMSGHPEAYSQLSDPANLAAIRATEARLSETPYFVIPEGAITGVADRIMDGDVIAATSTLPGLDVAHTGIAVRVDGALHLMHAPLVGSRVEISDRTLAQRMASIETQDGIMVARPR